MKTSVGPRTVVHPHPVLVIATYGKDGKPNMMTASWGGICCSDPPCIAVSLRKATLTYHNILASKAFTVNIPSVDYLMEADYIGVVSGHSVDKFKETGLTPVKSDLVNAPYVEEFPLNLECQLHQHIEIGLHTQFIGRIMDVKVSNDALTNGQPDIEKTKPLIWGSYGSSNYYTIGKKLATAFTTKKITK
jgi:flavin reductase (DIM6/NTAB) family NADH-FMN oxidoreductase RutF